MRIINPHGSKEIAGNEWEGILQWAGSVQNRLPIFSDAVGKRRKGLDVKDIRSTIPHLSVFGKTLLDAGVTLEAIVDIGIRELPYLANVS